MAIASCWILSFVVGLTPLFGWNNLGKVERDWVANGSMGEPVIKCEFEVVISMEYMVYFNFFVWVLPPLLLMVLIYLEVFYLIRKQLSKKVSASSGDPQKYYGKELKIAKSLALILFLFALSWLPLHILNCVTLFCPSCHKPSILIYVAIFLTHGNSAMNPIVYAFRIQKFRVTFLKIDPGVANPECEGRILKNLTSGKALGQLGPPPTGPSSWCCVWRPLLVTHSTPAHGDTVPPPS